jgi:tetratricopeptide (TPR) repeat protein
MYAGSQKQQEKILREAAELCSRVKSGSDDIELTNEAIYLQAACCLMLKEPQSVLDLLGETIKRDLSKEALVSQAYYQIGNTYKAKEVTQITIYQHLMAALNTMLNYLVLNTDNLDKAEEILNRALSLADVFNIEKLNPNMVVLLYAYAAKAYCLNGYPEKAINLLEKYVDVCINSFFPYTLHGDSFFDSIDAWLSELDLGIHHNPKVLPAKRL